MTHSAVQISLKYLFLKNENKKNVGRDSKKQGKNE